MDNPTQAEREILRKQLNYGDIKLIAETVGLNRNEVGKWFRCETGNFQIEMAVRRMAAKRTKELNHKLENL